MPKNKWKNNLTRCYLSYYGLQNVPKELFSIWQEKGRGSSCCKGFLPKGFYDLIPLFVLSNIYLQYYSKFIEL